MSDEKLSYLPNNPSFSSHAVHTGCEPSRWKHNDMVPPICMASTYQQEFPPRQNGYQYSRIENPTRTSLQDCLAKLEETKYCLILTSGMAAASTVTKLLKKGDHVITQDDLFCGNLKLFKELNSETDEIDITFVDASNPRNIENTIQSNTKLVWLETPTNPHMKLVDLKEIISVVKSNNPSIIIVCDNTFMTPYFQRPSKLGADIVLHSCTKYIGGHSDLLMGALCLNNEDIYTKLWKAQIYNGAIPSSFDCYLALRSLKTLEIRMLRHMSSALKIAKFLEDHSKIEKVLHPGLKSHPQHQIALKQCCGTSGIFSFYLIDREYKASKTFLENLCLIVVAESVGGAETAIKMPSRMSGDYLTEEEKKAQGITDGFFRISVGLENVDDLIADLEQALSV